MARQSGDEAVSLRDFGSVRDTILGILWIALAPVSVYAPKGTVILLLLFVVALPGHRQVARRLWDVARTPFGVVAGLFLCWAVVSSFWAPNPWGALSASVRLAFMTLAGLALVVSLDPARVASPTRAEQGLYVSVCLMIALLGLAMASGGALGGLLKGSDQGHLLFTTRGSATLAVMVFPVAILLARRRGVRWAAVALVVIAGAVVAPLPMFASVTALTVGAIVFGATWWAGARAVYAVAAVAGIIAFASPWIFKDGLTVRALGDAIVDVPASWQHRLGIWEFSARRAMERPVTGHGFDAAREIGREPGKVEIVTANNRGTADRMPLHPHSLALQLWLELGAVGVILALALLGIVARTIARRAPDRLTLAGLSAAMAAVWSIMSVSFGAWQNLWVAVIWLSVAVCAMSVPARRS